MAVAVAMALAMAMAVAMALAMAMAVAVAVAVAVAMAMAMALAMAMAMAMAMALESVNQDQGETMTDDLKPCPIEDALRQEIDRLTKERDEARDKAAAWRDEAMEISREKSEHNQTFTDEEWNTMLERFKLPWEKTDDQPV